MVNQKKVIKGLECCGGMSSAYECPYQGSEGCDNCRGNIYLDALILLKAQEPRVMTMEELEETGEPVFIELKTKGDDDKDMTCFGLLSEWDNLAFHFIVDQWLLGGEPFIRIYGCELKRKEYNIQWRPWNKLPTIKQMKAVKWE